MTIISLLPGMFAKITIEGQPQKDALLVPQRAVQQVLNKSFVIVVGPDNKSVSKIVELGDEVGSYYVVKSGLTKDDNVVVEGLTNLKEGQALNPTETNAQELGLSLTTSTTRLMPLPPSSHKGGRLCLNSLSGVQSLRLSFR